MEITTRSILKDQKVFVKLFINLLLVVLGAYFIFFTRPITVVIHKTDYLLTVAILFVIYAMIYLQRKFKYITMGMLACIFIYLSFTDYLTITTPVNILKTLLIAIGVYLFSFGWVSCIVNLIVIWTKVKCIKTGNFRVVDAMITDKDTGTYEWFNQNIKITSTIGQKYFSGAENSDKYYVILPNRIGVQMGCYPQKKYKLSKELEDKLVETM